MDHFFIDTLGFSETVFSFIVLPLLIFAARIAEVSVNTVRIIYMLGGRRAIATSMGFFEAFIWLVAIRQIFQHLDNWVSYLAYPGGFAAGIFVGMIIEEKIAYGKVIVRIITRKEVDDLIQFLNDRSLRYTKVVAIGVDGQENLVFVVLQRELLDDLLNEMKRILPAAFYTVETVRAAADTGIPKGSRVGIFPWLRTMINS